MSDPYDHARLRREYLEDVRPPAPATIPGLDDQENKIVQLMRLLKTKPHCSMIVARWDGSKWKIHETSPPR